jgi:CMP/dCMP kinase
MVVAIDGPAGAGKSTVARALARALGFTYLDSGAMYRAVALQSGRTGRAASEEARALDGDLLTSSAIRTPEVSEAASRIATDPAVRAALVERQRELMAHGDWVAEGRDIGTVVAPDAEVKVYLVADRDERAKRRMADRPGIGADALATDLKLRDASDAERMQPAADAEEIDTTELRVEEVVERIERMVRTRTAA